MPQKTFHRYRCLWTGCSVYGVQSLSRSWLERHVIEHVEKRPFPCIFNGCSKRFRTEAMRERHVHTHINSGQTASTTAATLAIANRLSSTSMSSLVTTTTAATNNNSEAAVSSRLRPHPNNNSVPANLYSTASSSHHNEKKGFISNSKTDLKVI